MKLRNKRVTKSEAARALGISRRTVIRYANVKAISQDRRGRVFLNEVRSKLESAIKRTRQGEKAVVVRGRRINRVPDAYRKLAGGVSAYEAEKSQADFKALEQEASLLGKVSPAARRAYAYAVIRARARKRFFAESINAVSEWADRHIEAAKDTDPNLAYKRSREYRMLLRGHAVLINKNAKRLARSASTSTPRP